MRRVLVFSAGVLAIAALGGCEADGGIAGPNRGAPFVFGGPSASIVDTLLVGSWTRTVSSIDETGSVRLTETVWAFNSDGSATRTTTIRDGVGAILDQQQALARWTVQGDQVVIDFTAPFTGRIPLPFIRQGETLILSGQTFIRGT